MIKDRRHFLRKVLLWNVAATTALMRPAIATSMSASVPAIRVARFDLDESSMRELQEGLSAGKYSSPSLVEKYMARIDAIDRKGPGLRGVLEERRSKLQLRSTWSGR